MTRTTGLLLAALASAGPLLAGCGASSDVDVLDGSEVGKLAERQLERDDAHLARGTLTCPDMPYQVGASVRCTRVAQLSEGRVVRLRGTVEITSTDDDGRMHVELDDEPAEFGLAGAYVAQDIRTQFARRYGHQPESVHCPYLRGEVRNEVTCTLVDRGRNHDVDVTVTKVDPARFDTDYTFRADSLPLPRSTG